MPKVSLVVPVRNGEAYLKEALESIIKQTFTDWECIVWDDGSQDKSRAIAYSFMQQDARFRVGWSDKPEGLPQTLNNAYSLCAGEYLGQCDSDDRLVPSCLEETTALLSNPVLDMVYTDSLVMNEEGVFLGWGHSKGKDFTKLSLLEFSPVLHFRLMRRELMIRLGGYDEAVGFAEDYHFILRAAWGINRTGRRVKCASIHHLEVPLYLRRTHSRQMTRVHSVGWQQRTIKEISNRVASRVLWSPKRFWRVKAGLMQAQSYLEELDRGPHQRR